MALQVWHGDLYRVSPFQAYRTSTSCWPYDLEFFMFAVMKTFVTDISASTGRNDFIFDMWLWHGDLYRDLYRVFPFQVYCTSTSCLPCDLRIVHVFTAFSGNECWDIYKCDTYERVGVFLARRSVQHLVKVLIHWNNRQHEVDVSLHPNILSWLQAKQSWFLLLNVVC
jgi:hypothetical protein